jgi:hypothetical protein
MYVQPVFNAYFVGMFMICLCTQFKMPSSSGSVEIAMIERAKQNFGTTVTSYRSHKHI